MPEPLTYLAMPLLFSAKLGVPVTFTASLKLSDKRMVLPAPTVPVPLATPGPLAATHCNVGAVVSVRRERRRRDRRWRRDAAC